MPEAELNERRPQLMGLQQRYGMPQKSQMSHGLSPAAMAQRIQTWVGGQG